jgi:4-amino-4-deoxy-L-arabinose transferase-like glycosyltransferase
MTKKLSVVLLIIIIGAFILRTYKLTKVPPSLNWDEVAAGYNAYTISHWGKDEWGNKFPLVFTSFRDDKHPIHIYMTAPFVGIFGLSDFTARFPAAIYSTIAIYLIFLLAGKMFKSTSAGLFAAFFLAISPYHIHFSRGLWEIDFVLFFFLLAITAFYYGLKNWKYLYLSYFAFGLSMYSYHSAKIVVPLMVLILSALYFKDLAKNKKHFLLSLSIFVIFILGLVIQPRLLGLARVNQTKFPDTQIKNTWIYSKTKSEKAAILEIAIRNYPSYFSYTYLFEKGDQNPRNSVKVFGEFYKFDMVLLAVGLAALILKRSRVTLVILVWLLLSPLPSALSSTTPNATRAMFMMGSMHLVAALGAATVLDLAKNKYFKIALSALIIAPLIYESMGYLKYYFEIYPKKDAIEWQYGMKQAVEFVNNNPQFTTVYMDKVRQQPYIYYLFYRSEPLGDFLGSVKYDLTQSKSYNTIESYDKFKFGNWDFVESEPIDGNLYILEPYKYSGLKRINDFKISKLIKYPNGSDAFYLVSRY